MARFKNGIYDFAIKRKEVLNNLRELKPFDLSEEIYKNYMINIKLSTLDNGDVKFEIQDKGIGIDVESFKRMSQVAISNTDYRSLKKYISKMPRWLRPTAGFGIGLQTIYLVADSFKIITNNGIETLEANINSIKKGGFIKLNRYDEKIREEKIKQGTIIEIVLKKDVLKNLNGIRRDIIEDYNNNMDPLDKDTHKYFDDDEMWENAEGQLREILTELKVPFYEAEGEAAFYGPKLDVQLKSAVGHDVTVSTCQLDFLLPEKFKLEYIGEDGEKHRPVVIHRAILGTLDRFMCFLIEETKGAFPLWLSPTQVKILPITDSQRDYAKQVEEKLHKIGIRVVLDDRNEKVGYKIREAQLEKVPYMLVVGAKEAEQNTVSIRSRENAENETMDVDKFVERIKEEVANKTK